MAYFGGKSQDGVYQTIINSGGRSIKDQLRNKLGLLPDVSNFKIKEDEN